MHTGVSLTPNAYLNTIEKRNFTIKNITKIINDEDKNISDQKLILHEVTDFYQKLYNSRDDILDDVSIATVLDETSVPKLSHNEKMILESPITTSEVLDSLKKLKNGKAPGTSGFQADFFKFFWSDMGHFIVRSFKCSILKGELSTSQKLGIITILPKGNKPRDFLKNWRPISLLNTTYKIFSGIIASRLKKVLNTLIHENQKGFLAGRFIGENTRLMYDIIHQTEILNKPGMILLLDFEKAFDSVSWKFIHKVLNFLILARNL